MLTRSEQPGLLVRCKLSWRTRLWRRRTGAGGLVDRCHRTDGRTFTGRSASVRTRSRRSTGCIQGAEASVGWHACAARIAFGAFSCLGPPDEAAERRRRPSCGESPATKLFVSSSAFRGYLSGLLGPTDGRTAASVATVDKESQPR